MHTIFISYAREDHETALRLAREIERRSWLVWWDRGLRAGQVFHVAIQEALDAAACVVVLWSGDAVDSDWVLDEAEEGRRRGILVPAMIQEAKIPLGFRRIYWENLVGWAGEPEDPRLERLMGAIARVLESQVDVSSAAHEVAAEESDRPDITSKLLAEETQQSAAPPTPLLPAREHSAPEAETPSPMFGNRPVVADLKSTPESELAALLYSMQRVYPGVRRRPRLRHFTLVTLAGVLLVAALWFWSAVFPGEKSEPASPLVAPENASREVDGTRRRQLDELLAELRGQALSDSTQAALVDQSMGEGTYDDRRRDPFVPLFAATATGESGADRERPVGKAGLLISELVFLEVFLLDDGPVLLVESAHDKMSYLLRLADQLWDGEVISITLEEVVFKQVVDDPPATESYREVKRRLNLKR